MIDTAKQAVLSTINLGLDSRPVEMVVDPKGTRLYIAGGGTNAVYVIDTTTNKVIATIKEKIGRRPWGVSMTPDGNGRLRLEYRIPARGLIGFRTEYLTCTAGTGLIYHVFDKYDRRIAAPIGQRNNGVLVSMVAGKALAYALFNLQERGRLFLGHADPVYEGMLVGIHSRGNDLVVNPTKAKQLTNIRAAGTDEDLILTPPIRLSLEQALEFIDDDELVEVTPTSIRLRKKLLLETDRKRESRQKAG